MVKQKKFPSRGHRNLPEILAHVIIVSFFNVSNTLTKYASMSLDRFWNYAVMCIFSAYFVTTYN